MIELYDSDGRTTFVAAAAVASVTEAGVSSQWHGIRSFVHLFDGRVIESNQTAHEVATAVAKSIAAAQEAPT